MASNTESVVSTKESSAPTGARWLRFSLAQLMISMLGLAVLLTVLFQIPDWIASVVIIVGSILTTVTLIASVVYCQGDVRAFCIGALLPALLVFVTVSCAFVVVAFEARTGWQGIDRQLTYVSNPLRLAVIAGLPLGGVAGVIGLIIRRLALRKSSP